MPRYLVADQIGSALRLGKSVEQFLGGSADGLVISWIEIRPKADGFQLWHFEVCDDGHEEFLDLYSFSPASGDWPESPVSTHATPDDALTEAVRAFNADPSRWVNQFLIQDEYRDYLPTRPNTTA
jgi:hypothetical protein